MIRIFLNNNLASPPKETDDLVEEFLLSEEIHGYVYQIQGTLNFEGEDYDYLRGIYDTGFCQDVNVDIQYSADFGNLWESKSKGIIKLADVTWNRIKRHAECPITDNSFLSKMNNNRNIVFKLGDTTGVVLSKNGVDVSSKVVYHQGVELFSPFRARKFSEESMYFKTSPTFPGADGDDLIDMRIAGRSGMFLWDAFNLVIAMMTDDEVDFASDFLSYDLSSVMDVNDEAFSVIMSGDQIRSGSGFPSISFFELFDDCHKLMNLWFGIEKSPMGKPIFRVEPESYFRTSNSGVYFDKVESLTELVNQDKLYSKIVVGCSQASDDFPIGEVPLVHHVQEEFALSGNCNLDNELNLRLTKLIINTNSIAEALPPISGFSNGSSVLRKYTTGFVLAPPHQVLNDTGTQFTNYERGFLIHNFRDDVWSYIDGIVDDVKLTIFDGIFAPDLSGAVKNYEIYKPSEDTQNKDGVFLIQLWKDYYDDETIFTAKPSDIDPPFGIYYYNEVFANYRVIQNHLGGVSQSIVSSISDGNDEFRAELTIDTRLSNATVFIPLNNAYYRRIRFNDDINSPNFDTNNNYDASTGQYIAPQGGYYHCHAEIEFSNNCGTDLIQQIEITKMSAVGDVIQSESALTTILDLSGFTFVLDRTFYLQEDERLQVSVKQPFNPAITGSYAQQYIPWSEFVALGFGDGYNVRGIGDTFFLVDNLYNGGGFVPVGQPDDARIIDVESEISMNRENFDNVLANPYKYYHTNMAPLGSNPHYISGYIKKISRGLLNGETNMTQFKKQNGV